MVTVPGLCVGDTTFPLRAGGELGGTATTCCSESKRKMRTFLPCIVPGTWVPAVHSNCHHNERSALLQRTLKPTPYSGEFARRPVLRSFGRIRALASKYRGERWDYETTANSYQGLLRRRYNDAKDSLLLDGPINGRDYKIKGFLKAEKVRVEKVAKPRMIFPRSPRYNLHIASWLKPFEHWLWGNLKSGRMGCIGNTRVVAKGLNQTQRANLIDRKMRAMPSCVVFEVDGSSFEAHVDSWQLERSTVCTQPRTQGQGN